MIPASMRSNPRIFLLNAAGAMAVQAAVPSDQVVVGVIGSGSRGTFVMSVFQKDPAVRIEATCDVYEPNLEKRSRQQPRPAADRRSSGTIKTYLRTKISMPC
jgi:hypothetical protein